MLNLYDDICHATSLLNMENYTVSHGVGNIRIQEIPYLPVNSVNICIYIREFCKPNTCPLYTLTKGRGSQPCLSTPEPIEARLTYLCQCNTPVNPYR